MKTALYALLFILAPAAFAQTAHVPPAELPPAPVRWSPPADGSTDAAERERQERVRAYLSVRSDNDLYKEASRGRLPGCKVWKVRRNPFRCRYRLRVFDLPFPSEEICSANAQASLVRCDRGSHKENVGCLVRRALEEGLTAPLEW